MKDKPGIYQIHIKDGRNGRFTVKLSHGPQPPREFECAPNKVLA
jgi:hypothetical protein